MRDDAHVDIAVTSKLAGVINASTSFALGQNLENGEVEVREYGKQIPGQMSIEDVSPGRIPCWCCRKRYAYVIWWT